MRGSRNIRAVIKAHNAGFRRCIGCSLRHLILRVQVRTIDPQSHRAQEKERQPKDEEENRLARLAFLFRDVHGQNVITPVLVLDRFRLNGT